MWTLLNPIGIITQQTESKNPELKCNGGDYDFAKKAYIFSKGDDYRILYLHSTSASGFDFCEITGEFVDTALIRLTNTSQEFSLQKAKDKFNETDYTLEELSCPIKKEVAIEMLNKH